MDSLPAFLALSLLLLNSIASAQSRICDADVLSGRDPSNQFQFPPPSCAPGNYNGISSYTQGTSLTIHWACTISPVNVAIIQQGAQDPIAILAPNYTGTSYTFSGYPPQSLSKGITFFFELFDPSGRRSSIALFASDYINITSNTVSSSSSLSSTASSTPSAAILATTSTVILTSQTSVSNQIMTSTSILPSPGPTSANMNVHNSSSNNSVAIGAGVGGGVGVALLILAVVGFFYYRRRSKARHSIHGVNYSPVKQGRNQQPGGANGIQSSVVYKEPMYEKQELEVPSHTQVYPDPRVHELS